MSSTQPDTLQELTAGGSRLALSATGQLTFHLRGQPEWRSAGPLCILHYYDRQHPRAERVIVPWCEATALGTPGTLSFSARSHLSITGLDDRTLALAVTFDPIQITLALTVTLNADGSGFTLRLDETGITENHPRLYRLLGLEVLPGFGAATTGETGYLLLPNWFGTRMRFDKTVSREVWQTIYSSNDQWDYNCNMAVFGITRAQGTLCGFVAQGDTDAQLVCRQHYEDEHSNSVHPYLTFRWQQQDERITGPREVRYAFDTPVSSHGEGYVFCGKQYRAFLRQERGLQTWNQKRTSRPDAYDYHQRFFLKIFMAAKEPHAEGKGPYHATCTFAEAQQIIEACLARGMSKLCVILVGWGQDGHDGMPPTRFPVDARLGGEAALKALLAWCKAHDVLLGFHDSYGGSYTCSPEHRPEDLIHHRTGEYWESVIWSGGQCHNLCPKVYLEKHVKRDLPAIRELGVHGHHHIDCVGSFMTCHHPAHPLTQRREFMGYVRRMFELTIEHIGSVSTEYPFGPYFDLVDGFFWSYITPSAWQRGTPIGRHFHSDTVPLLAVVLHGSLNCGQRIGETAAATLQLLDLGLTPQCEVAVRASREFGIPAYSGMLDAMARNYALFFGTAGLHTRLGTLDIEGRWERAADVNETLYSDGTRLLVNRSPAAYDGVQSGSYLLNHAPLEQAS